MSRVIQRATPRLRLRQWQARDKPAFARRNADPDVMRYFPGLQTREQSDRSIAAWAAELEECGWSDWAVEQVCDGGFVGFVGLTIPRRALPFMPCVECPVWKSGTGWPGSTGARARPRRLDARCFGSGSSSRVCRRWSPPRPS
ncbi:hypothetical protein CATMQ487_17730 [Sphaerotilus microaerophilus]|uniref:N-acetyltransferase domain-containing protein n=1 Tax=Sphaerotilus microaerophilus TaxID=2914710 RepID=A0ABN6PLF3_9BURK|nr:GNAT family N-acetyltransferase [Sphaerotilus sp. FB-5]BDI04803.1 hypothetical protein CATMQ487_17730 [Sphaerotilus sp. FB-5]